MSTTNREERRQTAVADAATGKFWCSSTAHYATGKPVIVRGRRICAACAERRKQTLCKQKEKARG